MHGDPPIITTGIILDQPTDVPDLYWVALPNGKKVLSHLSKQLKETAATFAPNDRVTLEMTPYDFDTARISQRA